MSRSRDRRRRADRRLRTMIAQIVGLQITPELLDAAHQHRLSPTEQCRSDAHLARALAEDEPVGFAKAAYRARVG